MSATDSSARGTAVTAGTFDGVHRGHQEVIRFLREQSAREGLQPKAVTFDRHPLATVAPERTPPMILSRARRDSLLRKEGVEPEELEFDTRLMRLSASEWMEEMKRRFDVRLIVMGYDHTFGRDGLEMTVDDYRRLAHPLGIRILQAPCVEGVSSSAIRKAVAAGDVRKAAEMMGRPFEMEGDVIHGRRLGHTIGFPTANLNPVPGMLRPAPGVYAVDVVIPDGRRLRGVTNIGHRPTVDRADSPLTIETHIPGFNDDLYGSHLTLHFLERLRDERTFPDLDSLTRAISDDIDAARTIF